jgi:hypothetical protein
MAEHQFGLFLFGAWLLAMGAAYWIWVAIKLSSLRMFILGFVGPIGTAPVGLYMLVFGVPEWVLNTFVTSRPPPLRQPFPFLHRLRR